MRLKQNIYKVYITCNTYKYCTMSTNADISGMRKPYLGEQEAFEESHLVSKEPYKNFDDWFNTARNTAGIMEANAMAVATASKDGFPSVRMCLLKGYDKSGFKFFSNYLSRKAQELEENPVVCLLFYWSSPDHSWSRQVRIEGTVEKLSVEESTEYFHSRPRASQIGATSSIQSSVITSRKVLTEKKEQLEKDYADESKEIPKPEYWGGYLVKPNKFEFWQGQTNRLHDRIVFRRPAEGEDIDESITNVGEDGWVYERLSP